MGTAPASLLAHWAILSSPAVSDPRTEYKAVIKNSAKWGTIDPCVSHDKTQITSGGRGQAILFALMIVGVLSCVNEADRIGMEM